MSATGRGARARLCDLGDRICHDVQWRRPYLVQCGEVLASIKLSWWFGVVLRHPLTILDGCLRVGLARVNLDVDTSRRGGHRIVEEAGLVDVGHRPSSGPAPDRCNRISALI